MSDPEPACPTTVRSPYEPDADQTVVERREKCGTCFPDGEIPDDIETVVTGNHVSKIHLPASHDVDLAVCKPDDPSGYGDSLARQLADPDVSSVADLSGGDA